MLFGSIFAKSVKKSLFSGQVFTCDTMHKSSVDLEIFPAPSSTGTSYSTKFKLKIPTCCRYTSEIDVVKMIKLSLAC
jgi:hypothetical protein